MYGLPPDFDANVFVGRELERICFTANSVIFHFDRNILIDTSYDFAHYSGMEGKAEDIQQIPVSESSVMQIIGHKVEHAEAERDGTLLLRFDNDKHLVFYDAGQQYEAYYIKIGDKTTIV